MNRFIILIIIVISCSGCELYEQDEYEEYYVIESYLVANGNLQQVRLSTTGRIEETYSFEDNTVSGATVEIQKLNPDSTIAERYQYAQQEPGIYIPGDSTTIQAGQLYRLQVTTQDNETITATTYVPGNFETVNELEPSYVYQSPQQVELTTTPSAYITDRQTYFIYTINALDPGPNDLTPFYADQVNNEETDIEEFYVNSSGIVNEGNFERNDDNTISLRLPWLAIAFYGQNNIIVNAIDDNLYDFLRSHSTQAGGSTLSPGEIQNIRYNVDGGIGIFGSMSSDTNGTFIARP